MKIKHTENLKVTQLAHLNYKAWVSIPVLPFRLKIIYKFNSDGKIISKKIIGFTKSILINFITVFTGFIVYSILNKITFTKSFENLDFLIYALIVLILMNLLSILLINYEVKKQLKKIDR